jgi:hypothetical protein
MRILSWPITGVLLLSGVNLFGQQTAALRPGVPVEPIAAIVEALRSHRIVAVTAGHGESRGYALLLSLVRDERFVRAVNDIVIEEGSALYQDVADRFVQGGEVSEESLSQIWQNTTQPALAFDGPWLEFFRAVRTVNASLPRDRQLRVVLGDPPIDWSAVHTPADHRKWIEMRDTFPPEVILREVIAKGRRALLTYGDMHFQRKNIGANYESEGLAATIVSLLEKSGVRLFSIFTTGEIPKVQPDAESWPAGSIALIRGNVLGAADFTAYYPLGTRMNRFPLRDGNPDFSAPIPREQWRTLRAEDQFDAVLYPGRQPSENVQVDPVRCRDDVYMAERLRRIGAAGLPPAVLERLKQYCAAAAPK